MSETAEVPHDIYRDRRYEQLTFTRRTEPGWAANGIEQEGRITREKIDALVEEGVTQIEGNVRAQIDLRAAICWRSALSLLREWNPTMSEAEIMELAD